MTLSKRFHKHNAIKSSANHWVNQPLNQSVSGIYTTFVMLMNTTSVMLTVLVLNLHHRHNDKPVPHWVRTIVFQGLARILCMHSKDHAHFNRKDRLSMRYGGRSERDKNKVPHREKKDGILSRSATIHNAGSGGSDGYSVSFAASQLTSRVRNSAALFPTSSSPLGSSMEHGHSPSYHEVTSLNNHYRTESPIRDEYKAQLESLIDQDGHIPQTNLDYLQEWKKVARIVDRLFFWLTLLALISVSVGIFCLLWLTGWLIDWLIDRDCLQVLFNNKMLTSLLYMVHYMHISENWCDDMYRYT